MTGPVPSPTGQTFNHGFRRDKGVPSIGDPRRAAPAPVSLPVATAPEADTQIRVIDEAIGRLYRRSPVPGTRRVLLKRTRYHVYYVANDRQVLVLALCHGRRGTGPPLRLP